MALDVTLSEECFKKSIKKFFVDSLYTAQNIYVEFDTAYKIPVVGGSEVKKWIVFHFDGIHYRNSLATGRVGVYLFTREDDEGVVLSQLRDDLIELTIDEDMTDGCARAPLYDLSLVVQQGMVITSGDESKQETAKDQTKYRTMNLYFKFGSK